MGSCGSTKKNGKITSALKTHDKVPLLNNKDQKIPNENNDLKTKGEADPKKRQSLRLPDMQRVSNQTVYEGINFC